MRIIKKIKSSKETDTNQNFYKKYRWFFTKSGKLVYGGKSARQNEEIVNKILEMNKNYLVMHTEIPGSPFAIIDAETRNINESDIKETANWTGCFSRAWREGMKKVEVGIFNSKDIYKNSKMKEGTFGVKKKIETKKAELKLALVNQRGNIRAIPMESVRGNQKIYTKFTPGNINKDKFAHKLQGITDKDKDEILNALPTGGFKEIGSKQ